MFHLEQTQQQTQALLLAPQLRQSLKLLQAPTLELQKLILEELQTNPTLEELPLATISLDAPPDLSQEEKELNTPEEIKTFDFGTSPIQNSFDSEQNRRREFLLNSIVKEPNLREFLQEQVLDFAADDDEKEALLWIIENLDEKGFLLYPLEEIAETSSLPLAILEKAKKKLQQCEPLGIACSSLQESLLFQLSIRYPQAFLAEKILAQAFPLFLKRRIPEIAKILSHSIVEINEAFDLIRHLDPAPGKKFGSMENKILIPDLSIFKERDQWIVAVNSQYIPKLRIQPFYAQVLLNNTLSQKDKTYIYDKVKFGKQLISALEQRQLTLERIGWQILEHQKAFFEQGIIALRPLTMAKVAEALKLHETTISRAATDKYVDTPHGLFPMKSFFTTGYTADKQTIANTSIKEMIAQFIAEENPSKPLSDQKIAQLLEQQKLKIARRTIAKYREELGILATHLRKKY